MEKKDVVKKRNPENCMQNSAASLPHAPSSVFPAHAAGKKRKPCLRKILAFWILMAVLGGAGGWIYQIWQKIPSSIRIRAGEEQELFLDVPVSGTIYGEKTAQKDVIPVNLNRPLTVQASQIQDYTMDVKLFGIVPFKPGGRPCGRRTAVDSGRRPGGNLHQNRGDFSDRRKRF